VHGGRRAPWQAPPLRPRLRPRDSAYKRGGWFRLGVQTIDRARPSSAVRRATVLGEGRGGPGSGRTMTKPRVFAALCCAQGGRGAPQDPLRRLSSAWWVPSAEASVGPASGRDSPARRPPRGRARRFLESTRPAPPRGASRGARDGGRFERELQRERGREHCRLTVLGGSKTCSGLSRSQRAANNSTPAI